MHFLTELWRNIGSFFRDRVVAPFSQFGWRDLLDILILAIVLYQIYRFFRSRRAGRVLWGLVVVVIAGLLVALLRLPTLTYLVQLFAAAAFFCVVLIFQPEIRDALERIGNSRLVKPNGDTLPRKRLPAAKIVVDETVDAVFEMSEQRIGALIVFEGLTHLGESAESGRTVDARVSSAMLQTIFHDKTPLHDGAVIIRDMRIWKAGCVLPSTKSPMDFGNMGTRHRAAVGITEVSDSLVVVVSEQTGTVSVAQDGILLRELDADTLKDILMTYIAGSLYLQIKKEDAKATETASAVAEIAARRAAAKKRKEMEQAAATMAAEEPDVDLQATEERQGGSSTDAADPS